MNGKSNWDGIKELKRTYPDFSEGLVSLPYKRMSNIRMSSDSRSPAAAYLFFQNH
jgi:hypothetical protein